MKYPVFEICYVRGQFPRIYISGLNTLLAKHDAYLVFDNSPADLPFVRWFSNVLCAVGYQKICMQVP